MQIRVSTHNLKKVIKRSGQSRIYKQLTKREFKEVKDFPNFTEVCMSIADSFYCMTKMMEEPKHEYLLRSFIWNHIFRNLCKDTNHFPVYACSPNLVELLQNTDPLEEYTTLKNVFTNCLILLPNSHNIFSDGKTNAKVTHILLSFYPHGYDNNLNQVPDYIMEYKDTDVDINRDGYNGIATLEGKCVSCNYPSLYYSFFDLDWIVGNDPNRESVAEGIIQFEGNNGNILRFGHEMKEDGYTVLSQIDSFVTNLFLFFQTQQNKEVTYVESKGFERSKIKKSKQLSLRSYIKLDVDNKTRVIKRQSTAGKHESPITHWRRGHWRNQPCGEKLQDSKIIWIQPTLINSTQE